MPKRHAKPTSSKVPTMAFAMPPPDSPTGLGSSVKKSRFAANSSRRQVVEHPHKGNESNH